MVECRRLKNVRLIFGELIRGFESRPLRLSFKNPGRISRGLAYAMGTSATETRGMQKAPGIEPGAFTVFRVTRCLKGTFRKTPD